MSKTVTIPCHPCRGTGHRTLPARYTAAFEVLQKLKRATRPQIHNALAASGHIKNASLKSLNMVYKQISRMEAWGAVRKVKRIRPANGDLRKSAWEFRVV